MSAGAPWSVKGIDPKAREVAKDLARRSGMTLGEWLNHVILEDDLPEEIALESQFGGRSMRASDPSGHDVARIAASLDRLTERIETSETRAGLAIHGVEHSIRQALARIETSEREQQAKTSRLEAMLAESSAQQGQFGERLRRLESEPAGPRSVEALRALETALARVEPDALVETVLVRLGDRVAAAEARTTSALDDLRGALGAFERRLAAAERGAVAQAEVKFEALAQVLTHRIEAVRDDMAQKLAASAGGQVEQRLAEMGEHIRIAEQRTAKAVEDMGRQVLSMAEAVGRKLDEVDQRGADAIDQVGSEVARIAGAVEARLARAEHAQADAFDRLGAEVSRVTDTLTERLSLSEQRAARAIEDVGAQVERVRTRIVPRPDADADDATVAGEARSFSPFGAWTGPTASGPQPEPVAAAEAAAPHARPSSGVAAEAAAPEPTVRAPQEDEEEDYEAPIYAPWRRLDLDVPPSTIPDAFAPIPDGDDEELFATAPELQTPPPHRLRGELSTREVIERARAAARAHEIEQGAKAMKKVRAKTGAGRLFPTFGARSRRQSTALQTALMVAGGAAFLSVGAAGLVLMQEQQQQQRDEPRTAESASIGDHPRASVALAPGLAPSGGAPTGFAAGVEPSPAFAEVRADVEAGVPGAVDSLKALAEAGHAQAQLYLAQLYDGGEAGLPKDPMEARRLTAQAADNGDVRAMHNLAVYYFRGEGGAQDLPSAVAWFRKAAQAGVVESQYNLGLIYQSGSGVPKDLEQARYWFRQAADRGDKDARSALAALTPGAAAAPPAPKTAAAPRPRPAAARPAPAAGPALAGASMNVKQTQLVLARLGYYDGPADGRANEAYRAALARYQRDQDSGPRPYTSLR